MPCLRFNPVAALSPFVETIYHISESSSGPYRHLVTPNAFMDLVIHLEGRPLSWFIGEERCSVNGPLLAGPYSKPFFLDLSEFTSVLGVRFRPGAAGLFVPIPANELHNLDISLNDVHRIGAGELSDEVLAVSPVRRQIDVVQRWLLRKLRNSDGVDAVVEHAVRQFRRPGNPVSVAEVESAVGLSHTRFIQVFRETVGMTPKLFCRVQRFQNAVQSIENGADVNWAELAAGCGYFDQAHLIRDFREFSGLTPGAYAERQLKYQRMAAAAHAAG